MNDDADDISGQRGSDGTARPGRENDALALDPGAAFDSPAPSVPWATFDRWARNLFLALALVALVAWLTVIGFANQPGATTLAIGWTIDAGLAFEANALLGVLAILALAWLAAGLDVGRPWARPAARNALVILVVVGLLEVVLDLTAGRLTIPLAAFGALAVISRRSGQPLAVHGRDAAIAGLLTVTILVTTLLGATSTWAAASGGSLFAASSEALDLSITSDCQAAAASAGDTIAVTVTWRWRSRDGLVRQPDAVRISWFEGVTLAPLVPDLAAGVSRTADNVATQRLSGEDGQDASSDWGVFGLGMMPPSIVFGIDPGSPISSDGSLAQTFQVLSHGEATDANITATFAHGSLWTKAESISCTLPGAVSE